MLWVMLWGNSFTICTEDNRRVFTTREKKSIVLDQYGFQAVGIMGKAGFKRPWATRFERFKEVLIALDPDATDKARQMAGWFGSKAKVVTLPVKPDDFFSVEGGTPDDFRWFLRLARGKVN